jgi:hypothetical protein
MRFEISGIRFDGYYIKRFNIPLKEINTYNFMWYDLDDYDIHTYDLKSAKLSQDYVIKYRKLKDESYLNLPQKFKNKYLRKCFSK